MSQTLRVGIVGVGGVGHRHIDGAVAAPNVTLAALCDPLGKKALENRAALDAHYHAGYADIQIPDVPVFTDYREMLRHADIDAVVIASPDATHCAYTVEAFRAGYHVLCEKPLAFTNEEAAAMVHAARQYHRRFFVGQVCRFSPAFRKAKQLLQSGSIGTLFCLETQYVHGCHADLPADDWRRLPPRHATACGGCHAFDLVRYFAGEPNAVFSIGNRFCRTDWAVEDCSETLLKLQSGAIARVLTTIGCEAEYSMRTVLYGTAGTITANNTADTVTLFTKQAGTVPYPVDVITHNTTLQLQRMAEAILFGAEVEHEGLEGAKSLFVCNAAIASQENGGSRTPVDYSLLA